MPMTHPSESRPRGKGEVSPESAVAIGVALSCGLSPSYGIPIGLALLLPALRDHKTLTSRVVIRLAVFTLIVALTVAGCSAIITDWDGFKAGFFAGYQG